MKLILNGGGSDEQIKESLQLFSKLVGNGKVVYIPLAWNNSNIENCINWFKSQVEPYGIKNIVQVLNANDITDELLNNSKGVFIGGGNTYKLLKMLKETEAYNNLINFMKRNDTVIMGGSAGALIFGKSIDTCLDDGLGIKSICDVNNVGLKDTNGFNCLKGYSILPHYKKIDEQIPLTIKRIERLVCEGCKLICIPEETSVFVDDENLFVVGEKPVEVIDKEKRIVYNTNKKLLF